MDNQLLETLFRYDVWATRKMLEACRPLKREQFEQASGIGSGSLERAAWHIVNSMFYFADRFSRRPFTKRMPRGGRTYTPDELLELFARAEDELRLALESALATHDLTDPLNWTDSDEGDINLADQTTYGTALAQVIDHGIHHRTQIADMLELMGTSIETDWHPFTWEQSRTQE